MNVILGKRHTRNSVLAWQSSTFSLIQDISTHNQTENPIQSNLVLIPLSTRTKYIRIHSLSVDSLAHADANCPFLYTVHFSLDYDPILFQSISTDTR